MNRWVHSVFGLSLAGLLVLLATHGPALIGVFGDELVRRAAAKRRLRQSAGV